MFIWERDSGRLVRAIKADGQIVNCVAPHPSLPVVATRFGCLFFLPCVKSDSFLIQGPLFSFAVSVADDCPCVDARTNSSFAARSCLWLQGVVIFLTSRRSSPAIVQSRRVANPRTHGHHEIK